MRLQFTIDDTLGHELQENADDLGLSMSSYVRLLIKKSLQNNKTKLNAIDKALAEESESITFDDFKKQLGV